MFLNKKEINWYSFELEYEHFNINDFDIHIDRFLVNFGFRLINKDGAASIYEKGRIVSRYFFGFLAQHYKIRVESNQKDTNTLCLSVALAPNFKGEALGAPLGMQKTKKTLEN
ncbi:MAG: hypothetical protein JXR53_00175 [Bacteroidales bacterium]|nr:hypothetical protein [Bacteroidales bacterium]